MPADDLVLNVRQIASYPPVVGNAPPAGALLIQTAGLGSAYASISPEALVATALASPGAGMAIGGPLSVLSVQGGVAQFSNAAVNILDVAQMANFRSFDASWGTIAGAPIATQAFAAALVAGLQAATVWSFNGRRGDVRLWLSDILAAGAAPIWSPMFQGTPMAPSPGPSSNSERLATTFWARRNANEAINCLLQMQPFVFTFNGRSGDVVLSAADLEGAEAAILDSPAFVGVPTAPTAAPGTNTTQLATTAFVYGMVQTNTGAILGTVAATYAPITSPQFQGTPVALTAPPGTATGQLATTAFVMNAVADSVAGVATWNGRSGNVTLEPIDLQDVGGALVNSPTFTGVPTAPTAAVGVNTNQIATCAFVIAELGGASVGVMSFNGRGGAVVLNTTDIVNAGGAASASPALIGVPTAPTAASGTATNQLATCAFVDAALTTNAGVTAFNGRTGAVTLTYADVSAAGGIANPSPALTGVPTAPTAATATNTNQIATTAFVYSAIAAGTVTTFNGRSGAVTLTAADIANAGGAPLASPSFTGVPVAPTAAPGANTTQLATTAFVAAAIAGYLPLTGGVATGNITAPVFTASQGNLQINRGTAVNPQLVLNDGTSARSIFYFNVATGQTTLLDQYSGANIAISPNGAINLNTTGGGAVAAPSMVLGGIGMTNNAGWLQIGGPLVASELSFVGSSTGLLNASAQPVVGDIANMAIVATGGSPSGLAFQSTNAAGSVAYFIWVDATSDARIKHNIRDTEVDALAAVLALPVRQFDFDAAASAALRRTPTPRVLSFHVPLGLVAQEVAGLIPDMDVIVTQPEGHDPALPTDMHAIVLPNAVPYLIRAIQQLEARVRELEGRTLH